MEREREREKEKEFVRSREREDEWLLKVRKTFLQPTARLALEFFSFCF